jgi:hypothetical protein
MNEKFNPQEHLITLKNKPYLEVKWRLVWMNSVCDSYSIETEIVAHELDKYAIVRARVGVRTRGEPELRIATATKREDKAHFPDYLEKAESGSVGRALGMLGYGTQWAEEFSETDAEGKVMTVDAAPKAVPDKTTNRAREQFEKPDQRSAVRDHLERTGKLPAALPAPSSQTASQKFKETMQEAPQETELSEPTSEAEAGIRKAFDYIVQGYSKSGNKVFNTTRFVATDGVAKTIQNIRANLDEWLDETTPEDHTALLEKLREIAKQLRAEAK